MKFPLIRTIDDVLPAIKGHDEFIVAERPFGTVVNYVVALEDSFDDPIRRECRGVIFYPSGKIMSRPYHKFFNLGEKNESRPAKLDMGSTTSDVLIMDKLDGSMIRPVYLQDGGFAGPFWRLGTKMGITDVADQADKWVRSQYNFHGYRDFIDFCGRIGWTPLFEWCSRQQRIVVDYEEDSLVLTAIRKNDTGEYLSREYLEQVQNLYDIPIVKMWDRRWLCKLQDLMKFRQDIEGWVVAWPNGLRVKMKVDWYVTLHKVKECIAREKYVIDSILDDYLDDLKGKLQDADLRAVEAFEEPFRLGYLKLQLDLYKAWTDIQAELALWEKNQGDFLEPEAVKRGVKKYLATELVLRHPLWMRTLLFGMFDGKYEGTLEAVKDLLKKSTRVQREIDENRHLWGGATYQYGGMEWNPKL